jgi:hypothetical protein
MCPGSNYIEIGLAIGCDLIPEKSFSIKNLFINKPLIFDLNKSHDIEIKERKLQAVGYAYKIKYALETYSAAQIYPLQSQERVTMRNSPLQLENRINHIDFYEGLTKIGLTYGFSFQRLRNIQLNNEFAYSDLIPYEGEENFICHPTSIYSAFQLFTILLAQLSENSETIFLPSSLEEIRYFQTKSLPSKIFLKKIHSNCFYIALIDQGNNIVVDMPSFFVKNVSKKNLYQYIENQNENNLSPLHRYLRDYFLNVLKPTPSFQSNSFLPLCQLIVIWATRLVHLFDSDEL